MNKTRIEYSIFNSINICVVLQAQAVVVEFSSHTKGTEVKF